MMTPVIGQISAANPLPVRYLILLVLKTNDIGRSSALFFPIPIRMSGYVPSCS